MKTVVEDVHVEVSGGEMEEAEIKEYLAYLRNKFKQRSLQSLSLTIDGDEVELRYRFRPEPFERIRRITGYLVGTMNKWNNAKRAEERDRVKHI